MRIIAVDDEKIALEALAGAIRAIVAEDEVVTFRYPDDAIEYAKENGSDFVFITHFPSQRCPFNFMDTPENNGLCQSFILLLDGFEIAGGGKKIHSFDEQTRKITQNGLALSDYSDFLELHKYALPPHGGCSIGLERLTMKLLDLENIKLARLFAKDMHHLSL